MKSLATDPVILICIAVIVAGILAFIWAVRKFRRMESPEPEFNPTDNLIPTAPDLPDLDFRAPALNARSTAPASPAVTKDVADRLDSMTQRLAEMQSVLMKQSSAAAAAGPGGAASGGVGQGFSPETIDKLLKIIGNVIQQVDILQKSVNAPQDGSPAKAEATASPFNQP